jgi:sec-independent protein translocase protein TatA
MRKILENGMNLGFWEWVAIALVVMLLFGTKRLRSAGEDLGAAVRGFKKGMEEEPNGIKKLEESKASDHSSTRSEDKDV